MESLCDFADQLHSHRRDAVGVLARRRVKVGKVGGRAGGRCCRPWSEGRDLERLLVFSRGERSRFSGGNAEGWGNDLIYRSDE